MGFFQDVGLLNNLPGLALNLDPLDLCLLSSRITGVSFWCLACSLHF
jgi:hypothetical protein